MATAATYVDRKAITADTGECLRDGCPDPAASGSMWCEPHRDADRKYQRDYRAKLRRKRRRKGLCLDCGKKLRRDLGEKIWCTRHRAARNRLSAARPGGVRVGVQKLERIRARTVKGDDGRTRYHGQKRRGQQTHRQLDEQDIQFARNEITRGAERLEVHATETDRSKAGDPMAIPKIQRDGIRSDALGYLERAQRHLDDVLERHGHGGHAMKRHGRRDGE